MEFKAINKVITHLWKMEEVWLKYKRLKMEKVRIIVVMDS